MSYIDKNGKFDHGKWMRERTLNEAPIGGRLQRSKVDYSTIDLKSNIDQKWLSFEDMMNDLTQWMDVASEGAPTAVLKRVGRQFKEYGHEILTNPDNFAGDPHDQAANADRSPEADADRLRQAMQSRQDREI